MPEGGLNVEGCVSVVTGAASGIGRAIAVALGARDGRVVLADVDADGLAEAVAAVEAAGGQALGHATDVSLQTSWASLAEATEREFGPAQLLVNNAGVMTRADLDDSDDDDWTWILGVNLLGVVEGVRTFLPQLRTHAPNAHIMNNRLDGRPRSACRRQRRRIHRLEGRGRGLQRSAAPGTLGRGDRRHGALPRHGLDRHLRRRAQPACEPRRGTPLARARACAWRRR